MYNNKKVSLIFPSFNEEESISKAIEEFDKTNIIDEIIAVDNNSTDKYDCVFATKTSKDHIKKRAK
jgi:glycosyltransferase involved in cell wall biosynthesis|tara:strand:- start:291 stop:488 length:198 start_codon:yes stop_codon:yes gene_type:complete